jgi:hypothetical protein
MSEHVALTFYFGTDLDDETGEPRGWEVRFIEPAEIVTESADRITFRQPEVGEWDAYRYDFAGSFDDDGEELGVEWAYGSSAELLRIHRAGA